MVDKKYNIMSIIRYNANVFVPTSFSTLIDRFFDESLARTGGSTFVPKVDIAESENSFEYHPTACIRLRWDESLDKTGSRANWTGGRPKLA